MTQQQRMQIDAVTAHIASTASTAAHHMSQSYEGSCNQAGAIAVQLAALKALLASVLSPAPHRPPFLPQALALFTQVLVLGSMLESCLHSAHMAIAVSIDQHGDDPHSAVWPKSVVPKAHTARCSVSGASLVCSAVLISWMYSEPGLS